MIEEKKPPDVQVRPAVFLLLSVLPCKNLDEYKKYHQNTGPFSFAFDEALL